MSGELDPPRRDLVEGDRFFEEKIESILSSVFLRDSFGGAVVWSIDLHASCRRKVHGVRAWNRSTAHEHPDHSGLHIAPRRHTTAVPEIRIATNENGCKTTSLVPIHILARESGAMNPERTSLPTPTPHRLLTRHPNPQGPNRLLDPQRGRQPFHVTTSTVARWSDAGKIGSTTTLGGHRRYPRAPTSTLSSTATAQSPSVRSGPSAAVCRSRCAGAREQKDGNAGQRQ